MHVYRVPIGQLRVFIAGGLFRSTTELSLLFYINDLIGGCRDSQYVSLLPASRALSWTTYILYAVLAP